MLNYTDLIIKMASILKDQEEEMLQKEAGVGAIRGAHKLMLKNIARASSATPSAVNKLRAQGLVANVKGMPNGTKLLLAPAAGAEPVDTGLTRSSLALLGVAPNKPGKGRSLSKLKAMVTNPSRTTAKVIAENKDTLIPSAKSPSGKGAFNTSFMKDLKGAVKAEQAARTQAKTVDQQFARNIRNGKAGLVPYVAPAAAGKGGLGWLWKLLGGAGAIGAGAGAGALLGGGSGAGTSAATLLAALSKNPYAIGAAGVAGLAGAGALANSLSGSDDSDEEKKRKAKERK